MLLLGLPALPIPTGGATHAFEVIDALLEDILLAIVAFVVGLVGVLLIVFLGAAVIDGVQKLF